MTNLKVSFFILKLFIHKCLVIKHTKITLERWWEGGGQGVNHFQENVHLSNQISKVRR